MNHQPGQSVTLGAACLTTGLMAGARAVAGTAEYACLTLVAVLRSWAR